MGNRIKTLRKLHDMTLLQLADKLNVSESTVQRYESGNIKNLKYETIVELANIFNCSPSYVMAWEDESSATHTVKGIRVPVYGTVAAGIPIEAIENIVDYEEIPDTWRGEYAALKVKGDSMLPRIQEGDVLIVRRQSDAESGDIVVAMVNGEDATVKKLIKKPDGIVLQPLNPLYEPLFFSIEQRNSIPVAIWGKVVENRQKF